jgi:hypothetical protein
MGTDPIDSWLDARELRVLAERLIRPVQAVEEGVRDAGFGEGFEGFAVRAPESAPTAQVVVAPVAEVELPVEEVLEETELPARETGGGPAVVNFEERLARFREWLEESFPLDGFFLLDGSGRCVMDSGDHVRLHFLARSLAAAPQREGAVAVPLHVRTGTGSVLEVLPVATARGGMVLGLLAVSPLGAAVLEAASRALREISEP